VTLSVEVPGEGRLPERLVAVAAEQVALAAQRLHQQSSVKEPSGSTAVSRRRVIHFVHTAGTLDAWITPILS
jgi:hypothetical protein